MNQTERRGPGRPRVAATPEQQVVLDEVARIAEARRELDQAYPEILIQAREAGATFSAIARAAGVGEESVRQTVKTHGSN